MTWNSFSFLFSHEETEAFLQLNTNILETNLVNILILISLIVYGYKLSFRDNLKQRQTDIIQTIENAQKDLVNASNYYYLAEKGYTQSLFWLQSWRTVYQQEKIDLVNNKYKLVKKGLLETFSTSENLIKNFENKAFLALQRYMILVTASKILRKFLSLSEDEQSKFIEITISKLGGLKK